MSIPPGIEPRNFEREGHTAGQTIKENSVLFFPRKKDQTGWFIHSKNKSSESLRAPILGRLQTNLIVPRQIPQRTLVSPGHGFAYARKSVNANQVVSPAWHRYASTFSYRIPSMVFDSPRYSTVLAMIGPNRCSVSAHFCGSTKCRY